LTVCHQSTGKVPILITEDRRIVIETPVIISYLIDTYDTTGNFKSLNTIKSETISAFAAASLGRVVYFELFFELLVKTTP
jgi:glutathione S-transferase